MRRPRAREVGRLRDQGRWDRAHRAYLALVEGQDPAAEFVARGENHDVRPRGDVPVAASGLAVVSGPDDLRELRAIVEQALGTGAWPTPPDGRGERLTATISVERPAALLGVLVAMEGVIEHRSPWRTWRTAVESLTPAVAALDELTLEARIISIES